MGKGGQQDPMGAGKELDCGLWNRPSSAFTTPGFWSTLTVSLSLSLSSLDRKIFNCICQWKDPLLATWGNAAQAWESVADKAGGCWRQSVKVGIGT